MEYQNKSREELIVMLEHLSLQHEASQTELEQLKSVLDERRKELNCHLKVGELLSNVSIGLDELCEKVSTVLAGSMQFEEIAEASVRLKDKHGQTPGFDGARNKLVESIITESGIVGEVAVGYPESDLPGSERIFLSEESALLSLIAMMLGRYLEKEERKSELVKSEARYKAFFDDNSSIMLLIDPDTGEIKDANSMACKFYGWSAEQIRSMHISEINTLTRDEISEEMNKAMAENRRVFHFRHRLANGETRDVEVNSGPMKQGEKILLYSIVHDISERKKSDEALWQSQENLNIAQEIADMGSWVLDFKTNRVTWSKNFYRLAGVDPALPPLGMEEIQSLIHPEDQALFEEGIQTILHEKKMKTIFFRLMPGKRMKWIQCNIVPRFEKEEIVALYGVSIDITAKKQAEEEIRLQNARLSAVLNAIPDNLFILSKDGAILEYYTRNQKETLISEKRIIGTNIDHLFEKEVADLFHQKNRECLEQDCPVTFEFTVTDHAALHFLEVRLSPVDKGKILAFLRDITERKQKDISLKRMSLAIEQSPVLVVVTDLNGAIEYVNPAFTKTTGYDFGEIKGKNPRILKSGKTDKAVYRQLWETITHGKEWQGEWINRKKNGELYWESVSVSPIYDETGKITNYLALKQDITQKKQAEQEILELNESLELKIRNRTEQLEEINNNLLNEILVRKKAEEALQTKSTELENFFTVALDLLCISDDKGRFIKVNKAWEEILGYSVEELEHRNFLEFIHPDDTQANLEILNRLNDQLAVKSFTNRYRTKDGSYRFIEWKSVPVGDKIYSAARDITQRKHAEEFEFELLQLAPKLTGVTLPEVKSAIHTALFRIGRFLHADRAYIFEFSVDMALINNTFEWCEEGINPEIENLQEIPSEVLPMWMECLKRHENILIPSVADLPESWQAEKEVLEPQGIQSLIVIPMLVENHIIGFVGLDSVRSRRDYSPAEINTLKVWSSMLSSLINTQRTATVLEQTRQNYETFFNTIDDFLWVLDEQGNIIHTNDTVKKRLEYDEEELNRQSVLMVHPPERREEAGRIVGEMLEGISEFCPVPLVTKSGRYIPVETRVKHGFWDARPVIFGLSKDVSKIKLSEEKFSRAFESNAALMAISRFEDGVFLDVNNAFLSTLGFTREEFIGGSATDLIRMSDSEVGAMLMDLIRQKKPIRDIELELFKKDGSKMTGLFSSDLIYVGDELCLLTMLIDISARKKAEEELRKARQEADKANLAKSEFLSRMSHELRTPMNSILGFAQLLEMGELSAGQKKGVNHIMKSGKHLLDLINEVLDISRIEAGRLSISLEPVNLDIIIHEMMDIVKPQVIERNLTMNLISTTDSQLYVKSDRQRLKQVLLNLINNALKYNREGGSIFIQTEKKPVDTVNNTVPVRISITDTGMGISPENLSRLFIPFERFGAEKTATEGTGLGLAVVKKLIDAMGGNVGVESTPEVGSTFWIELPYCESQLERAEKSGQLTDLRSDTGEQSGTVLYIEDNSSNVELVEQILTIQRPGINLVTNAYGRQAVGLALKHKPSLILLDLNLPDIHGSEVLGLLQVDEGTSGIPVVIISADAMQQQLDKLLKAGARHYLTKPLNVPNLLKVLDEFVINRD